MVLTDIEKLDGTHPNLAAYVRGWFDAGKTNEAIPAMIMDMFGVSVTASMVGRFRCQRWAPDKELVLLKKLTTQAAVEAFGGDAGFDSLLLAKLWELMDKMTIPQLLTARALFVKIKAQNLKEQEFLFKTGQLKPKMSPEEEEAERNAQSRNALRRIKEIFGLAGDEPPKIPVRQLPAPASEENA
jgi:hypothetical protein